MVGEKKEGADAYNNTWSYSVLYGTLAEPVTCHMDLREGSGTPATAAAVLPGMIGVGEHLRAPDVATKNWCRSAR